MKCLIVFIAVLAVSSAQYYSDATAKILKYDKNINPDGSYRYAFETESGIAVEEQGTPRNVGGNPPITPIVATGYYAYTSPEGVPVSVSYNADENGFQPTGNVLPTSPPIPPQIQRALDWLARNTPQQRQN